MFVVGGIQAALFLGAWNDPFGLLGWAYWKYQQTDNYNVGILLALNCIGVAIFISKALAIIFIQMWLRWTLPRPRIDQVLYVCIKVLLPFSCILLLGAAIWTWLIEPRPGIPWLNYNPFKVVGTNSWFEGGYGGTMVTQIILALIGLTGVGLLMGWIAYAAASGRNLKQRLTEPAPIAEETDAEVVTT